MITHEISFDGIERVTYSMPIHINNRMSPTKIIQFNIDDREAVLMHVETYWHIFCGPEFAKFAVELRRRTQARTKDFR